MPNQSPKPEILLTEPQSDADYSRYYELRWRVLREPWQQPRGSERDELEAAATHLMLVNTQRQVLAVGRLHQLAPGVGQIRYMAVDPDHCRQGLGTKLLTALEEAAQQQGLHTLILQAREPVIGFYLRHGYQLKEKSHILFGEIQHYKMQKTFN